MKRIVLIIITSIIFNSCATIWGGPVNDYQSTKPKAGEPARKVRVVALIGDIVFLPIISIPVDFLTCAIYRPEQRTATTVK